MSIYRDYFTPPSPSVGTIKSSYNIGEIDSSGTSLFQRFTYLGGIIGDVTFSDPIHIENCYYINNVAGAIDNLRQSTSTDVPSSTAAEMLQQSSYTGFDFNNIWSISSNINNGYPYLMKLAIPIGAASKPASFTIHTN